MDRVDIAIIGSGPAGISAAINAKIRSKSFLLFGSGLSTKVELSEKIDNYPAIFGVTGHELNEQFNVHMKKMGIEITEERVTSIYNMGEFFYILADQKAFEASCVILATGAETVKPIEGEREFLGLGVSYCATCDGGLYKNRTIAVVCENNEMEEEVHYLAELADKIYYFPKFKSELDAENVELIDKKIKSVNGVERVEKIVLKDEKEIEVDGVFFLKEAVSADVLLKGLAIENGYIVVDHDMKTNIKGCFAAGDCTGRPFQIAKAVGEGNTAALSAFSYLAELKK